MRARERGGGPRLALQRALVERGRELELPPLKPFVNDLLAVKKQPAPGGGFRIVLPTTRDGRHCDFASALAKAVKFARAVPEIQRKQGRLRNGIPGLGLAAPVRQLVRAGAF